MIIIGVNECRFIVWRIFWLMIILFVCDVFGFGVSEMWIVLLIFFCSSMLSVVVDVMMFFEFMLVLVSLRCSVKL